MSEGIQRITPDEASLSSISVNIKCPQGCPRTFANSSALRFHIAQFHQQEKVSSSQHGEVWYHCPVESCIYHHDFGPKGKHFPKLKYLKQHYLKVHAERCHTCDCGQSFSTTALLSHHKRACGLQLLCGCGRIFSSVETLQTHARRSAHSFHPNTIQALRERRTSLSEHSLNTQQPLNNQNQAVWHHIPIKYQNLDNISRSKGNVLGVMATSSTAITPFASVPPIFTQTSGTVLHTSSTFSHVAPLHLQQPTHLLAAIALSELAATAMKRVASVDIGVQTDGNQFKRHRRKSTNPSNDWSIDDNIVIIQNQSKQKRTAETQTRLTHRDSKRLNNNTQLPSNISNTIANEKGSSHSDSDTTFLEVGSDECNDEDESSLSSLTLQVDLPEFITTQQSTSGTQTSPRAAGLAHSHLGNLAISLFDRACGDDEPSIPPPSVTSITATQTNEHLDPFATTQLLIDADEDLLVVGRTTNVVSQRAPSLSHIRSSSIETQTDHDVLLSGNASAPDDTDEIILTTTETQTDPNSLLILSGGSSYQGAGHCQVPGACQGHDSDSLWCTSETQTYEDFSDIEQFMCSTIHTQTPDHSHNELFPELSFTHTQTQTSLDDPPALVTTHTQTPKRRQ